MTVMETFRSKKVLVTGGAGFVGSNLAARLIELGAEVTVLDDLFTGDLGNLPDKDSYSFVEGSVADSEVVNKVMEGQEFVFHLAARNIIISTKNPLEDYSTNIGGTLNILITARKTNPTRIVYSSSASVYGNPRHLPIVEDESLYTLTPYSVSKLAGENYCNAFYESYDIPVSVVRYSNVYGRNQDPLNPYCGVVSKFLQWSHEEKPVVIHGDGMQTRDFTYVEDVVEATLFAGINPKAVGETFNVATGQEVTVNELAGHIIKITGSQSQISHIDKRDIDNIRRRVLNTEKIRKKLRWVPEIDLQTGIKRTNEWYMSKRKETL